MNNPKKKQVKRDPETVLTLHDVQKIFDAAHDNDYTVRKLCMQFRGGKFKYIDQFLLAIAIAQAEQWSKSVEDHKAEIKRLTERKRGQVSAEVVTKLNRCADLAKNTSMAYTEALVIQFLAEKRCKPSQAEIVHTIDGAGFTIRLRIRGEE